MVASEVESCPQSSAELASLRRLVEPLIVRGRGRDARATVTSEIRYHGVEKKRDHYRGKFKWFKRQINLTPRATAFEAAVDVAHWYEAKLGASWGLWITACGKLYPAHNLPWQVRKSESRRGYVAAVWVAGHREEVVTLRRDGNTWKPTDRLAVFRSEVRAIEYLFVWLVRLYGAYAPLLLWRRREPTKFPCRSQ